MNYVFDTGFIKICYDFIFPETAKYFGNYIVPSNLEVDILVSKEELIQNPYGFKYYKIGPFSEYQNLMVKTGKYLLKYNACMFHGTLIEWKDMGILFCAPSGTGKTTQYRMWRSMDSSIKMINGDKPILQYNDNEIIAHSSPWNGKEQYGRVGLSVPLKAIILLERGDSNHIGKLCPSDAVIPLFTQFIAYPDGTEILKQEASFLNQMLSLVPVWKLINIGDIKSARLTLDTLEAYYGL